MPGTRPPSYRYELRALASLARFLPVFLGAMLCGAFTLSVLYDTPDIVLPAWTVGAELIGLFGAIGLFALPVIALVTARLRRGRPRRVLWAEIAKDELVVELAATRPGARSERVAVPLDRLRGGCREPAGDGVTRLSLELAGGLAEGDRIVLELPAHLAAPIAERVLGAREEHDLSRRGYGTGLTVAAAAIAVSGWASQALLEELVRRVGGLGHAVSAAARHSWGLGLFVALTGICAAFGALLARPRRLRVGLDGVFVPGTFASRFVGFAAIRSVHATRWGLVVIHSRGGRRRALFVPAIGVARARLDALARELSARAREGAAADLTLPPLEAGPCTADAVGAWRERLATALAEGDYRVGALSSERLADAVARPGSPARARVAAALVLAAQGDREQRTRIRVVAEGLADDTTRALLLRIAEEEADDASLALLVARQSRP